MQTVDRQPLLRLEGVKKQFGTNVFALKGVSMEVHKGRVHGLLGANGAGKSTLIKILSGAHEATDGAVYWKDQKVSWTTPKAANDMGVATIHQHVPLVPTLSVLENIFLGEWGMLRHTEQSRKRFEELCEQVQFWIDPDCLVSDLRIGERQMVSILQALGTGAELIIMDEPTASLAAEEREHVYRIVKHLSKIENKAILFVSHFLDEVMELTDCVSVLRDGVVALEAETEDLDEDKIAEAIVGGEIAVLEREAHAKSLPNADDARKVVLKASNLTSAGKFKSLDLELREGEVIGLAGLLGSGRSEIVHALYGADGAAQGVVELDGVRLSKSPAHSVKAGIALVPEDRNQQGLFSNFELWKNVTLPALKDVALGGVSPSKDLEVDRGERAIEMLKIKAHSADAMMNELSGGNAQKVSIARWLFGPIKVLLLDEPTAGIDIGAKTDILKLVRQLAQDGIAVIIVSSEFEELLAVCDRILVVRDGAVVAQRYVQDTSEHELFLLSGGKSASALPEQTQSDPSSSK